MANDPKILPSSGIATTQQPQQNQPKRKGTGFTNLSRILQASQGSKLGQTIAGGITGQAQQVQSGIQTAQDKFKKEAKTEADKLDEEKRRGIIENAASKGELGGSDVETFQNYLSGQYKGPMELANQQQLANQAQQAETLGRLASGIGSRSGTGQGDRQQLLRRFAGGADYTSGQRKLDESILARDKQANLAAAARQTRGVAEEAQRAGAIAQAQGQEYQNVAKQFAKETAQKVQEAKQPISSDVDKIVSETNQTKNFLNKLQTETKLSDYQKLTPEQKQNKLISDIQNGVSNNLISKEVANQLIGDSGLITAKSKLIDQSQDLISALQDISKTKSYWRLKNITDLTASERGTGKVSLSTPNVIKDYIKQLESTDIYNPAISSLIQDPNISRTSLASQEQASKLNALDMLLQKKGADLEFLPERQKYQGVSVNLDPYLKSLYESQSEQLKKAENIGKWFEVLGGRGKASNPNVSKYGSTYGEFGSENIGEYVPYQVDASKEYQAIANQRSKLDEILNQINERMAKAKDKEISNK
jgi:hypothetical protein